MSCITLTWRPLSEKEEDCFCAEQWVGGIRQQLSGEWQYTIPVWRDFSKNLQRKTLTGEGSVGGKISAKLAVENAFREFCKRASLLQESV